GSGLPSCAMWCRTRTPPSAKVSVRSSPCRTACASSGLKSKISAWFGVTVRSTCWPGFGSWISTDELPTLAGAGAQTAGACCGGCAGARGAAAAATCSEVMLAVGLISKNGPRKSASGASAIWVGIGFAFAMMATLMKAVALKRWSGLLRLQPCGGATALPQSEAVKREAEKTRAEHRERTRLRNRDRADLCGEDVLQRAEDRALPRQQIAGEDHVA